MKIKKLHIKNFKSIADLEIIEPSPFTVFVGPNGAGKSNIFEALEYAKVNIRFGDLFKSPNAIHLATDRNISTTAIREIENQFDGHNSFLNFKLAKNNQKEFIYECLYDFFETLTVATLNIDFNQLPVYFFANLPFHPEIRDIKIYNQFYFNFSRIFIGNNSINKPLIKQSERLYEDASNLEVILKRLLDYTETRNEIIEWLELFIPGFTNVDIIGNTLQVFEKESEVPFPKSLISDGTYNILALLTAVYQSDEPQFLCIEEPENGLNPFVIRKLVDFFRQACEDKGHYIWLNTHSQTLVECLTPEEIIVVDKVGGETKIKQIKGMNLHGLDMAEVWLSGALGGGTPW